MSESAKRKLTFYVETELDPGEALFRATDLLKESGEFTVITSRNEHWDDTSENLNAHYKSIDATR